VGVSVARHIICYYRSTSPTTTRNYVYHIGAPVRCLYAAGGILSIVAAVSELSTMRSWGWYVFTGIISLITGLLVVYNPFVAGTVLIYLFAFWAMMAGIAEIATAIRLRKQIEGEGWYILLGILTIAFSLLILINPAVGALTLSFMFGIFALVSGIMLLSLAIRLRKRHARSGDLQHGAVA
jgi:uncharacterized membrane protein HdeD (DUF308 family)